MKSKRIMPMPSSKTTALSILSSPKANLYFLNRNMDLDFETYEVLQIDNIVQHYTDEEDATITSGLGLLA
ncbi:hypothetical protein TrLO_g4233 [Triparma laevis f. longispina]|uniref:Uncharacterized protein n=1 Tax=Triparma laevis f. longispina TaxID=1714387 RepID=A0A9W7AKH3_9STRA|nr:hypothetical protein TrLO_g4233 [Triparma laevis f. longispina]